MLTKFFIFGLLCCSIIQAFPTPDDDSEEDEEEPCPLPERESNSVPESTTPANQKFPCIDQLDWVKNTTVAINDEYQKYYDIFAQKNIDIKTRDVAKAEHEHMEQQITDTLNRCDVDIKKIRTNVGDQFGICRNELKQFSIMNSNLSALTQSIRPKVIEFAKRLGLPQDTIDDLDHTLGRIVNFMFIIDMGKNTLRDLHSMIKEAWIKTEDGIKLEEKYEFTKQGVEPIGELEEKEKIGHVEEPAIAEEVFIKPKDKPHQADKEPAYTVDEEAAVKELEDLIDFEDKNIEIKNKELTNRENYQKAEMLKEEQRLAEQARLEEEARLAREREMAEKRVEYTVIQHKG